MRFLFEKITMDKTISIIVAVAENNAIGYQNQLLTHISADLKRFKEITKGHTVVMGRNTWLSLPKRPLPNRTNIVITSDKSAVIEGATVVHSINEAIQMCPDNDESFIIGGASVYNQCYPLADKIYLTQIHKAFQADTFFPEITWADWQMVFNKKIIDDEQANVQYSFIDLHRVVR